MRHAEGASAVRSVAQHRSDNVARSTPTRALARDTPKLSKKYESKPIPKITHTPLS
ncbi:MAG: hypothetical protein NZ455_12190 [Bacteroidia bacterium]|nr:hypothetical protein [Bacteroidia bacterium]MDW8345453.1 hypothetical protein [Bacteroidia bacterium]